MNYKTDDGHVIWRRRRAPQLTLENMRRFYARFEIDIDVAGNMRVFWNRLGNARDRIWQIDISQEGESLSANVFLAYSDDRTQTWNYLPPEVMPVGTDINMANAYLNYVNATWH
jgi:hypothetical protein